MIYTKHLCTFLFRIFCIFFFLRSVNTVISFAGLFSLSALSFSSSLVPRFTLFAYARFVQHFCCYSVAGFLFPPFSSKIRISSSIHLGFRSFLFVVYSFCQGCFCWSLCFLFVHSRLPWNWRSACKHIKAFLSLFTYKYCWYMRYISGVVRRCTV